MPSCLCARLRVDGGGSATLRVDGEPSVSFGSTEYVPYVPEVAEYGGSYEVTPSGEPQVLPTRDLLMAADLTIQPIPSNYGLVTWDGSTLTVS